MGTLVFSARWLLLLVCWAIPGRAFESFQAICDDERPVLSQER